MSDTRTLANQNNARHSTGPRTEDGKTRSSQNALRHGLTSTAVVLPHEDAGAYRELQTSLLRQHQPQTAMERELVIQMANAWWRLQRAYRVETELFAACEDDAAIAALFTDPKQSVKMRLFMRYLAAAERAWNKAQSDFEKLRKQRLAPALSASDAADDAAVETTISGMMARYAGVMGSFRNPEESKE